MWTDYLLQRRLDVMTADMLRDVCRRLDLTAMGTKGRMIDRILECANPVMRDTVVRAVEEVEKEDAARRRHANLRKRKVSVPKPPVARTLLPVFNACAGNGSGNSSGMRTCQDRSPSKHASLKHASFPPPRPRRTRAPPPPETETETSQTSATSAPFTFPVVSARQPVTPRLWTSAVAAAAEPWPSPLLIPNISVFGSVEWV